VTWLWSATAVGGRVDQRFDGEMRQADPGKVIPQLAPRCWSEDACDVGRGGLSPPILTIQPPTIIGALTAGVSRNVPCPVGEFWERERQHQVFCGFSRIQPDGSYLSAMFGCYVIPHHLTRFGEYQFPRMLMQSKGWVLPKALALECRNPRSWIRSTGRFQGRGIGWPPRKPGLLRSLLPRASRPTLTL